MAILTQVLGVCGFFLAIACLIWQVWSWKQDRVERVAGEASYFMPVGDKYGTLAVRLWNSGNRPVYITSVALTRAREIPASEGIFADREFFETLLASPIPPNQSLAPGQPRTYTLLENSISMEMCSRFTSAPTEQVWVAVHSAAGEILRLDGREFISFIKCIAMAIERDPQAKSQARRP